MLRNLADKLYEKHKNAALDIEGIVKQLATAGDHDKITAVINLEVILLNVYACSQIKTREIVALKKIRMDNERERVFVFTSMCHKLILPSVSHKTMMPNLTNPQPFPRATFSS
ncbi:hypothetical protein JHK82_027299 [Glycine max]|uniref:Uncharacterized protein n=1 Tax=Glycine soja TaxID=3848 RepID=A0A0B2SU20_GLYSO|nr:hypothetical protein JHK87_027200 [Glycine soja]KAG5126464.1 hypothetical protein JHK82_027299 [Glycine max]KHN48418.1 hypothetical protein glysoja_034465 [Glycine soja]